MHVRPGQMRIAIINYTSRRIGGVETYLEAVLPLLQQRGHELGFWAETDVPFHRPAIALPIGTKFWLAKRRGRGLRDSIEQLKAWKPDVLYLHKLDRPSIEARMKEIAPVLFFAHDFHGTCISGNKAFAFPTRTPCHRCFGAACLLNYYPRRCGGLNPYTMFRLYFKQRRRLHLLRKYETVIVASDYMATEYRKHGVAAEVIVHTHKGSEILATAPAKPAPVDTLELVFLGRFEKLKGGVILLKSLPQVARKLGMKVRCHFAGQGTQEEHWKALAGRLARKHPSLDIVFHGWISTDQCNDLLAKTHLMVMPSTWPEPFGGVGFLAGDLKVPAVAFDVGGISHWLQNGVNGVLAPGDPPTISGLGDAIVQAVRDPERYQILCEGAHRSSSMASMDAHVKSLEYWLGLTLTRSRNGGKEDEVRGATSSAIVGEPSLH
jgi:glycosyltransferase involved in cell wall biosynthesis